MSLGKSLTTAPHIYTRLFIGQPVWTPFNRPCEEHESRKKYVSEYLVVSDDEEKKES